MTYREVEMYKINSKILTDRDSGIEALKIVAIFFIVISHVVQTLTCSNIFIINNDYVLNSSQATTNIQKIILVYFRHFGILGNTIFFTASAWFLLESYHFSAKNIFYDC